MAYHAHLPAPVCLPDLLALPSVPTDREAQVLRALADRCRTMNIPPTRRQVAELLGENRRGQPNLVTPVLHALAEKGWAKLVNFAGYQHWEITPAGQWHATAPDQRRWLVVGPSKARLVNRASDHRNALKSLVAPYRDLPDEVLREMATVPANAPKKHRAAGFVAASILSARSALAESRAVNAADEAEAR